MVRRLRGKRSTTKDTGDMEVKTHAPRPPCPLWWRVCRGEKGATMLEAALITPLLLLLTFSIIDFASMFYVYLALENGASQATRYAVTGNQMDDPNNPGNKLSRADSIKLAIRHAPPTITLSVSAFTFTHLAVRRESR